MCSEGGIIMNTVRIYSFCKLEDGDINYIRKKYGIVDKIARFEKMAEQQQTQIQTVQKAAEQYDTKIQDIQKLTQQHDIRIHNMQKIIDMQQAQIKAMQNEITAMKKMMGQQSVVQPAMPQQNIPRQNIPQQNIPKQNNAHTQQAQAIVDALLQGLPSQKNNAYTQQVQPAAQYKETNAGYFNCNEVTRGKLAITKYIGEDTSVVIPRQINKKTVTSIGYYAFGGCFNLNNVIIPDTVTQIGDFAFSGCLCLSGIMIPNSVNYIGTRAFFGCSHLTSITIPSSVTKIGSMAFSGCSSLKNIIFKGRKNLNGIAFDKNWNYDCNANIMVQI